MLQKHELMPTLQIPKLEGEGNSLEGDTRVPICREFHVQNKEVGSGCLPLHLRRASLRIPPRSGGRGCRSRLA